MLKVFRIEASSVPFDSDDSIIVVAESKERALEIAMNEGEENQKYYWKFKSIQYPLKVVEIDLKKEHIINVSHYGD